MFNRAFISALVVFGMQFPTCSVALLSIPIAYASQTDAVAMTPNPFRVDICVSTDPMTPANVDTKPTSTKTGCQNSSLCLERQHIARADTATFFVFDDVLLPIAPQEEIYETPYECIYFVNRARDGPLVNMAHILRKLE